MVSMTSWPHIPIGDVMRAIARLSNLKELTIFRAGELQGEDLVRTFSNHRLE